uniref:PpsA n=1 Tax=Macrostomum lignano TaxID=282301 RepID=A0A1I8FWJ6_9PLAT
LLGNGSLDTASTVVSRPHRNSLRSDLVDRRIVLLLQVAQESLQLVDDPPLAEVLHDSPDGVADGSYRDVALEHQVHARGDDPVGVLLSTGRARLARLEHMRLAGTDVVLEILDLLGVRNKGWIRSGS